MLERILQILYAVGQFRSHHEGGTLAEGALGAQYAIRNARHGSQRRTSGKIVIKTGWLGLSFEFHGHNRGTLRIPGNILLTCERLQVTFARDHQRTIGIKRCCGVGSHVFANVPLLGDDDLRARLLAGFERVPGNSQRSSRLVCLTLRGRRISSNRARHIHRIGDRSHVIDAYPQLGVHHIRAVNAGLDCGNIGFYLVDHAVQFGFVCTDAFPSARC